MQFKFIKFFFIKQAALLLRESVLMILENEKKAEYARWLSALRQEGKKLGYEDITQHDARRWSDYFADGHSVDSALMDYFESPDPHDSVRDCCECKLDWSQEELRANKCRRCGLGEPF